MNEMKEKKRRVKVKPLTFIIIVALVMGGLGIYLMNTEFTSITDKSYYLKSLTKDVKVYNEKGEDRGTLPRGVKVKTKTKLNKVLENKEELKAFIYKDEVYYIKDSSVLTSDVKDIIMEKDIYVRTSQNLRDKDDDMKLLNLLNKGSKVKVLGYDKINEDGTVNKYLVEGNGTIGNIYGKYTAIDYETAIANYEPDKYYTVHKNRGNKYGGDAGNLDYYPTDKPKFENNVMPTKVYALYLNNTKEVINNVSSYIEFAKTTKINAFVVDIKDSAAGGYKSPVMQKYSKTSYEKAFNEMDDYKAAIKKIKDAGFYVIGRITTFKDEYYIKDHEDHAIANAKTSKPLLHNNSYWPSAFIREVWEYNVLLAKEAVTEMGFNEIQFDYIRFPDGTGKLERQGIIDYKNTYKEDKAQAIQRFLQYAVDELHKLNVYVSADVFGESAHNYVTAYGQYFAAISNVVDVISAMPYPDHFNKYDYGFDVPVWTIPYDLLSYFSKNYAGLRQKECPTPAIARTWIATYDTIKEPYITYGAKEVSDQIRGLFEGGLNGGYMTWNSASNLAKYKSQKDAYSREY
ncbi:MAG: putative glycoside hydrolase [Bacilli bacterium]